MDQAYDFANFRIESLVLRDVGVFKDTRIDFMPSVRVGESEKAEVHLFTGTNGCGKSTLLYALASIFDSMQGGQLVRRRFLSADSMIAYKSDASYGQFGVRYPEPIYPEKPRPTEPIVTEFGPARLWYNDISQGMYGAIPQDDFPRDQHVNNLPSYKQLHQNYSQTSTLSAATFPFAAFAYSGQRTLTHVTLGAIQEVANSPFESALSFDSTARPHVLIQWIANNRAMAAMAKADEDLIAAEAYDRVLNRITSAIREICQLNIQFKVNRSPLSVAVSLDGWQIPFDGLPDGLKSIISWVADLTIRLEAIPWTDKSIDMFAQKIFLFLDEIDVHLHPRWQRRILPAVQKLLPNAQIFASTHSPFVVGSIENASVYLLPERGKQLGRSIKASASGAGKSYRLILDETFGIDEEFDVKTESMFDRFYEARDRFLANMTDEDLLKDAANALASRSDEARVIVETELRQVSRRTGKEVRLAQD